MSVLSDEVLAHVRAVLDEPDLEGTKYRLVKAIGRGGMASVFAVEDAELGRQVALKVSLGLDAEDAAERLRREARVVARLEHPGIVPIHDVGVLSDGRVYYAMKLVRGETLAEWVRKEPTLLQVLRLFQRICEAVGFAHAHGVVHRDLKPENVMIGEFGEALVMDWGVARAAADETQEGVVIGTPAFMAPEQARGHDVDARADVYGLGATLRHVVRDMPKPLASIVARATAGDRDARYASASELAEEIGRFVDGERVHAHRETVLDRATRFASRHRVVLTLLGVYIAVRVVLAFWR
jgi:eukaryotic-like serine/threonine-protein kinase